MFATYVITGHAAEEHRVVVLYDMRIVVAPQGMPKQPICRHLRFNSVVLASERQRKDPRCVGHMPWNLRMSRSVEERLIFRRKPMLNKAYGVVNRLARYFESGILGRAQKS